MKAVWQNKTIAESDETIMIEGNQYFPPDAVNKDYLEKSATPYNCPWKGEARYFNVAVDGKKNEDAAFSYPKPKEDAIKLVGKDFSNYVAFWKGVEIS